MPTVTHSLSITAKPQIYKSESGMLTLVTVVFTSNQSDPTNDSAEDWHPSYYAGADVVIQCYPEFRVISFEGNASQTTLVLATESQDSSALRRFQQKVYQIIRDHDGVTPEVQAQRHAGSIEEHPGLKEAAKFIIMIHRVFPMTTHRGPDAQHRVFSKVPELPRPDLVSLELVSYHPQIEKANPVSRQLRRQIRLIEPPRHDQMQFEVRTFYSGRF